MLKAIFLKIVLFTLILTSSSQMLGSNYGNILPSALSPLYPASTAPAVVSQFLSGIMAQIKSIFHVPYSSPFGGPPYIGSIA